MEKVYKSINHFFLCFYQHSQICFDKPFWTRSPLRWTTQLIWQRNSRSKWTPARSKSTPWQNNARLAQNPHASECFYVTTYTCFLSVLMVQCVSVPVLLSRVRYFNPRPGHITCAWNWSPMSETSFLYYLMEIQFAYYTCFVWFQIYLDVCAQHIVLDYVVHQTMFSSHTHRSC